MKYKVKFLPSANYDINELADALSEYPNKAKRIFQEMEEKIELVKDNPKMFPVYQGNPKYRRINLEDHALFYIVSEALKEIHIYRVIYSKRDIENLLSEQSDN